MKIQIKNLRLKTIIGFKDWERTKKQDIVINIKMKLNGEKAAKTENIEDTLDYDAITKRIIKEVEKSNYYLLEKLTVHILKIIMDNKNIIKAKVEVDKPLALQYADSVSVSCSAKRKK